VIASNPAPGDLLTQSPTQLTVQFSEPVNLSQLAFVAYSQVTGEDSLSAVFIEDQRGVKYYPRFESYDAVTNTASFLMLDRLPSGNYALHLSGAGGLTDLAGNPLVDNGPGGDWVIKFQVQTSDSGLSGDPASGYQETLAASPLGLDDLGVLFPHEVQAGITLTESSDGFSSSASVSAGNQFRFHVLQSETYYVVLTGSLPAGIQLSLTDDTGNPIPCGSLQDGQVLLAQLAPGIYRLEVSGWEPSPGSAVTYEVHLGLQGGWDNPPPLLSGPIPALALHFGDSNPAPNPEPDTPRAGPGGVPVGPPPLLSTTLSSPATQGLPELLHGLELSANSAEHGSPAISPSEISGPSASHVSLAFLGMGPLGGVGAILQTEEQTSPDRLALSTSSNQGQGLLALVPTHSGATSPSSPTDLNLGNDAQSQPVADPFALSTLEPARTPNRILTIPAKDGPLDHTASVGNEQVATSAFQSTPRDSDTLWDEPGIVIARLDSTSPRSLEATEASAVPDWASWVIVAGILSLVSSKLSQWRRTRSRFGFRLFSPSGGGPTGWPWRRTTLPRPHLALGRCRRSDRGGLNDQAFCAAERG
jgi:hypothetical protein